MARTDGWLHSQDNQISEDTRFELHSHLRLHSRAADEPLHPQTCSRELRHFAVERRPNLEIQLEMVVRTNTSSPELATHVINRLLAALMVHLSGTTRHESVMSFHFISFDSRESTPASKLAEIGQH